MGTNSTTDKRQPLSKLSSAALATAVFAVIWLGLMIIISFIEIIYVDAAFHFAQSFIGVTLHTCLNDLYFWSKTMLFIYPIGVIAYLLSPRFTNVSFYVLMTFFVILQFALNLYFTTALVPLGADAYGYSWSEIRQTVGSSGVVNFRNIAVVIILVLVVIALLGFLRKRIGFSRYLTIGIPVLALLITILGAFADAKPTIWKSDFMNNLVQNKTDYLWRSSFNHYSTASNDVDIYADNYIVDYSKSSGDAYKSFKYVDPANYPFMHSDTVQDVLSPLLKTNSIPPNIVIIVVEGLGRAFTNDGAYLGNFTPFIDSLSDHSIYWKNFLSEGGRTFAALPSILGSLPFAKNGFLELGNAMPNHLSLVSLLKYNGYHTSFYYGGDAHFDNMDVFLYNNHIDELNDGKTFPSGYVKLPAPNGFSWGYNDKSLFTRYLDSRSEKSTKPQLSVILTVSTHSPFAINEESKYLSQFEKRMDQLTFTGQQKDEHRVYKLQYASILYLDDCLRGFFNAYRKRSDYNHTVFLITGDHRMPEIPMSDKLDRYHVPLIIYSPMLKAPLKIASVSTHFDIGPSLLAYLKHSYHLKIPSLVSWMGQGLDTNHNFRNIHSYPLMQTKTDIIDFIQGDYHLNEDNLFKINGDLGEDLVQDDAKSNELKNNFRLFKTKNAAIISGEHIIPDSIYRQYLKTK